MKYHVLVRKRWSVASSYIDAARCDIVDGHLVFYDDAGNLLAAMSQGEWSAVEKVQS